MASLYRCQNPHCSTDPHGRLIFDFEADEPVCPKCGSDRRKPEHSQRIVKLVKVHYHAQHPEGPDPSPAQGERYRIACDGKAKGSRVATDTPSVVTCPDCKKSEDFQRDLAATLVALEEGDFPIEVDLRKMVIRRVEAAAKEG